MIKMMMMRIQFQIMYVHKCSSQLHLPHLHSVSRCICVTGTSSRGPPTSSLMISSRNSRTRAFCSIDIEYVESGKLCSDSAMKNEGGGACQRGIETTRIIIIISMKTLHLRVSTSRCEATVSSRVPVVVAVGVAAVPPPFAARAPLKRLFNWSSIHSPALTCPSRLLMQATHSQ